MSQFGVSEADTTDHVKVKVKLSNLRKIGKYNKKIKNRGKSELSHSQY